MSSHFHSFPFRKGGVKKKGGGEGNEGMIRGLDYEVFSPTSSNIMRHNLRKTLKTPMSPMFSDLTLFNLHFFTLGGPSIGNHFCF